MVWGPQVLGGERPILARATVAIPSQRHAEYAEALGCRAPLRCLANSGALVRAARVVGNSPAVVRYCAQVGRLRLPALQALLEGPLCDAYAMGWQLEWLALRRMLNTEADALATDGVFWASRLTEGGEMGTRVRLGMMISTASQRWWLFSLPVRPNSRSHTGLYACVVMTVVFMRFNRRQEDSLDRFMDYGKC